MVKGLTLVKEGIEKKGFYFKRGLKAGRREKTMKRKGSTIFLLDQRC